MTPYGIAATLSDAVALVAAFGCGARIAIGHVAPDSDILAPGSFILQPAEAAAAIVAGRPQYFLTFGNTQAPLAPSTLGPMMDQLATGSGAGFLCACLGTPWMGRTVYQGHLFENGNLRSDLKRDLSPYIDGAIGIVPHQTVAAGFDAIRRQLTAMKERGIRLALLDVIDDDQCGTIARALARQPIIAGPSWLVSAGLEPQSAVGAALQTPPTGPLAMISGALDRQTLIQTAAARDAMPVLDLDFSNADPEKQTVRALAFAQPHFEKAPFLITSSAPPDRIRAAFPATEILAAIAQVLHGAGIRNFLLAGNDTAAAILRRLGITQLTAGAAFAGLRWLHSDDNSFLIKPGGFGAKNLFLYDFEPQSRLNEPAE